MELQKQNETTSKKKEKVLYSIIVLLILALGASLWGVFDMSNQKEQSFEQGVKLKGELDQLMDDFTSIKIENQDLSSQLMDRDSLIMANAKEIEHLIATQADYSKIKKKLDLLRGITQDYVHRIDSLVVVNQQLTTENVQIKEEIQVERTKNTELSQEKTELQEKVHVASAFKAYNLNVNTVRLRADGKEVPTDKASRLSRINIAFTLSENSLVEKGTKNIYARISRPDGVVLVLGQDDSQTFTLTDGKVLQYSVAKDINYDGKAMDVKFLWEKKDKKEAALDGKYDVMLYMEGNEIGRASFIVRP